MAAELESGPCTFLLALRQVLTLPWWQQSSEVALYLSTCLGTSADSTLVVVVWLYWTFWLTDWLTDGLTDWINDWLTCHQGCNIQAPCQFQQKKISGSLASFSSSYARVTLDISLKSCFLIKSPKLNNLVALKRADWVWSLMARYLVRVRFRW